MGSIPLTSPRVHGATSAESPPIRQLFPGWDGELQSDEQRCLQRIVVLETNDAGQAFQRQ